MLILHVNKLKARQEQGHAKSASDSGPPDEKVLDIFLFVVVILYVS